MLNIAKNTFKEIVRNRFLYLILFFAFVFILFSIALWELTIGQSEKVIVDFGLGMIEVFGLIWVLFVGSQLLFKEVDGKTIFLILSKPIKRQDFILGKFFGFSGTIALIVIFQALLFLWVLLLNGIGITHLILWALFFTFLKLEILLAIVFFFSTFMSNIISHSFSLILDLFVKFQDSIMLQAVRIFQVIFPPMQALNIKDVIGSFTEFSMRFFMYNTVYSLLYILIILFFTIQIFSRKTFEG
jgi:ABC-type transport system involved in multi-copper enzyme maturation permease subunit